MAAGLIEVVSQSLHLPPHYCCQGPLPDAVEAYIYYPWIRAVVRDGTFYIPMLHDTLSAAEIQSALQLGERIGDLWQRVLIQVIPKNETQVYPLARNSGHSPGLMADVSYSQLLHYVATSNNKNLWKDAYKKYSEHGVAVQWKGGAQVGTDSMHNVLREVLWRLYGCKVIPIRGDTPVHGGIQGSRVPGPHTNVLPAICAFEADQHILVILNSVYHNVLQCVSFSPGKLIGSEARPLFILYQILEAARDTHDRGLHLGNFTLSHLFIDDSLYLSLLPSIPDNLIQPDSLHSQHTTKEKAEIEVIQETDSGRERSRVSPSMDASQCIEVPKSDHISDTQDPYAENNYATQCQQTSTKLFYCPVTMSKKVYDNFQVNDGDSEETKHLSELSQLDRRLLPYQKLMSSEEAFDILKQAS